MIVILRGENSSYKKDIAKSISDRLVMPRIDIQKLCRYFAIEFTLYRTRIGSTTNDSFDIKYNGDIVINGHIYNEYLYEQRTITDDISLKFDLPEIKMKVKDCIVQYVKNKDIIIEQECDSNFDLCCCLLSILITKDSDKQGDVVANTSETSNALDLLINSSTLPLCSAIDIILSKYYDKLSANVADNHIKIDSVRIYNNTLFCDLALPKQYWVYFNTLPWLSYTYNFNVSTLPNDVALIPFVSVLAPLIWSTGLTFELEKLDSVFYESLKNIQKLFSQYFNVGLHGMIKVEKLCTHNSLNDNYMMFYSGGVDATTTLFDLKDEISEILIMKGFDRPLEEMLVNQSDLYFHRIIPSKEKSIIFAESPNLHNINYTRLNMDFGVLESNMNYWCCYCVGLYTFANAVVPAYLKNNYNIVLSSSYKDEDNVIYGASKVVIEYMRTSFCKMVSYGDNYSRMDKLQRIIQKRDVHQKVVLRVCKNGGIPENCCQCEKCARTILGLYALGENPKDFGFNITLDFFFKWLRINIYKFSFPCVDDWIEIVECIKAKKHSESTDLSWLFTIDIEQINVNNLQLRDKNKKLNW